MNSFGTMNHLEVTDQDAPSYLSEIPQPWQTTITTVVLLMIAYYGWPYLAYETTIKRRIYEIWIWMMPTAFVQILQKVTGRITGLPQGTASESPGSQSKSSALNQIYQGSGVSSVVQRARSLSGFDKFLPVSAETTYPGLGNWDNSCFQNSVLQGLASLHTFKAFIDKSLSMITFTGLEVPTHQALKVFMEQLQSEVTSRSTVWPPSVLRSMNTWQQQDAQEYFSKVMDAIEKEDTRYLKLVSKRLAPSLNCLCQDLSKSDDAQRNDTNCNVTEDVLKLVSAMLPPNPLNGCLTQSLRCQRCKYSEGLSLIPFNCLTLNLGLGGDSYIEDLLDAYTDPELIEGVECDECTRLAETDGKSNGGVQSQTKTSETASETSTGNQVKKRKVVSTKAKQILFGRLPQNLAFHINRSIFDEYGNQRKNVSHIRFPTTLNIGEEWMESPLADSDAEIHGIYELRCIITHQGRHDNGHYVACGKRGKEWYLFNDEVVTRISEEQVLARGHVFMLFYEEVDRRTIFEVPPSEISPCEDIDETTMADNDKVNADQKDTRQSEAQQSVTA